MSSKPGVHHMELSSRTASASIPGWVFVRERAVSPMMKAAVANASQAGLRRGLDVATAVQ